MIPSEDMIRAYRLRAGMAIAMIVVGVLMLVVSLVHLVLTYDFVPLVFAVCAALVGYATTRRLLDPSRIGVRR